VLESEAECQTAVATLNAAGLSSASYTQSASSEWPQGCFYHVNGAYWQGQTSTGGPSPPTTPDDGEAPYICRSSFSTTTCADAAACAAACSGGTAVTSYAECMEASVQQVSGVWWTGWARSTQCATGHLALVSEAECSNSFINQLTTYSFSSSVGPEWNQGCFVHGSTVYWQAAVQTGSNTPIPDDGGNPYVCRAETDPGPDWPQGCFVHSGKVWFQPSAQTGTNAVDGGMVCATGFGSGATAASPLPPPPPSAPPPSPDVPPPAPPAFPPPPPSGFHINDPNAQIHFGPNRECTLALVNGALQSNCPITSPPLPGARRQLTDPGVYLSAALSNPERRVASDGAPELWA